MQMRWNWRRAWLVRIAFGAVFALAAMQSRAGAPDASGFYKGKTISLITSTGIGGTYDVVARFAARYMPAYVPGTPTIIVQNMPGGGNVLAANYMYNIAPQDGTAIATMHSAIPLQQVIDPAGVRYDADKFNWLGSTGPQNEVILAWRTAGITTIAQAMDREMIVGGTGSSAGMVIIPAAMNSLLGTKFKIVTGYRSSEDVNLAMVRGEVQARAFSLGSIVSQHPDWLSEHKVVFLAQVGIKRDRLLPEVPLLMELAKNEEQRRIFEMLSSGPALGQPYMAPPGLPADRLAVLRQAFAATLSDAGFLGETQKMQFEIDPMSAADVAAIVHETIQQPADIVAKAKAAMTIQSH
jgi:tripartite-type tricarboxylate transporter receptor subunit TctC